MRAINSPCSCLLLAKMDSGKFRRSAVRLPDKMDHGCFGFIASFNRPDKLLRSPPPVGDGDSALRSLRSQHATNLSSPRLVTSVLEPRAVPPLAVISLTSASIRSFRLAPSTTLAPFRARRRAVHSPIPLLAPVITTTLSTIFEVPILSFSRLRIRIFLTASCPPQNDRSG